MDPFPKGVRQIVHRMLFDDLFFVVTIELLNVAQDIYAVQYWGNVYDPRIIRCAECNKNWILDLKNVYVCDYCQGIYNYT